MAESGLELTETRKQNLWDSDFCPMVRSLKQSHLAAVTTLQVSITHHGSRVTPTFDNESVDVWPVGNREVLTDRHQFMSSLAVIDPR